MIPVDKRHRFHPLIPAETPWAGFPTDILHLIFFVFRLSIPDLLTVSQTCKKWHKVVL
jgi:hypothetical protein